ncbi:MAG: GNAT family N-acetyltransferase [Dehalococcoidia bacterium]
MTPNYHLRPATAADSDALYAIHRAALERYVSETWGPWDEAEQRAFWTEHWPASRQAVVIGGELAGFLDLDDRPGSVWVGNIELHPLFQKAGIGSAMLRAIQADASARGLGVSLQVLKVNPARRLYERLGFRETGQTETHYQMAWEAPMQATVAERTIVAFLDGEDSPTISNPIHSTEVAAQYGFRGALVGGVTVYGWFTPVLLEVLGERWLTDGWADVRFRRPTFPGDKMTARAERNGDIVDLKMILPDGDTAIVGTAGLGKGPWFDELTIAKRRVAEPKPDVLPILTLEGAIPGEDLRPMPVPYSVADATAYATDLQKDDSPRFNGEGCQVHPGWIAARMTPMLKHSYQYGPSIHIRSQIQHLARAAAGQDFTMAGTFLKAYEQKGHHVAELDGSLLAADGTECARMRHTTIFRIRPPKS